MESIVMSLRLVTGEEIITEITKPGQLSHSIITGGYLHLTDDQILVDRPHVLHAMPGRDGQMGLVLMPWFNSDADAKNICIKDSSIVAMINTPEKIAKGYLQQVSGIALI